MELITPQRLTETGNIDFLLQRSLTGDEDLHTHSSSVCKEVPSTNKQDKQHQKNGQHTDTKFTRAVSEGFLTRICFMALFHSISVRAVQYSMHQ